jgi:hypothetical protein
MADDGGREVDRNDKQVCLGFSRGCQRYQAYQQQRYGTCFPSNAYLISKVLSALPETTAMGGPTSGP